MMQRLSRNLRHLHQQADEPLAALRDVERVLLLVPLTCTITQPARTFITSWIAHRVNV